MKVCATQQAEAVWNGISERERARTLAATYFAPSNIDDDSGYKKKGVEAIVKAAALKDFGQHWQNFVRSLSSSQSRVVLASLESSLALNLSGGVLEHAGISLEHCCGVPIIPGSAVKGAARRYAIALLRECDEVQKEGLLETFIEVFGCVQSDFEAQSDLASVYDASFLREMAELYGTRRGLVHFLQAVPLSSVELCADVLTPHHSSYMKKESPLPTDDESPTPSYFPVVSWEKKPTYAFVLYAPRKPELLDNADEWLSKALTLYGLGAKTTAGYGVFSILRGDLQNYTPEQMDGMVYLRNHPEKIRDLFKLFTNKKEKEKHPMRFWAILHAISLPEDDSDCKLQEYRDYLNEPIKDPSQKKSRERMKKAMNEMAQEYNIQLPQIP